MMSKVRCSDLEIGLSFFDDHLISEATLFPPPIRLGLSRVPSPGRTSSESGIDFNSLIL